MTQRSIKYFAKKKKALKLRPYQKMMLQQMMGRGIRGKSKVVIIQLPVGAGKSKLINNL